MKPKIAVIVTGLVAGLVIGKGYADETTAKPAKLLDYIESTGAQYIDTGVEAKMGTKASLDIMWRAVTGTDVEMFSANGAGNTYYWMLDGYASGSFYVRPNIQSSTGFWVSNGMSNWPYGSTSFVTYANNTRYRVSVGISTDGVYSFAINGGAYTQSGTATKKIGTIAASGQNFYLFGCNKNGTASNYSNTKARCYGTKIWQVDGSGEYKLVRDFLPCLDSDGVACLYDTVSKELFYSKTATAFTAGNELSDFGTPDAFLEYIDSTGAQYIDTGAEARAGTKAEMKMQWKAYRSGYNLDAYLSATSGSGKFYLCELNYERWWCAAFGSWENYVSSSYITGSTLASYMNLNTDYTVISEVNQAKTWSMSFGGGSATRATGQSLNTLDVNFYMFACNSSGTAANHSTARCYYTKIWQTLGNGEYELIRDFVPCLKDGVAGLYDQVSGSIFKSKTDTAFTAGSVVAEIPDKFVEYVYSDGRQFVDTGIEGKMGTRAEMTITWKAFPYMSAFLGTYGAYSRWYVLCQTFKSNGFYLYVGDWKDYASTMTGWPYGGAKPAQDSPYTILTELSNEGVYSLSVRGSGFTQSGTATKDVGQITQTYDYKFYMFANNKMGTMDSAFSGRCYGTKIWQTDASGEYKIVRDFKPCVKGGRPGLYDAVSRRIFYSGSGTDLLVDENTEVEPQKFWADFTGDSSFDNPLNWWGGELPAENEDVTIYPPKGAAIGVANDYALGAVNIPNGSVAFSGNGVFTITNLTVASGTASFGKVGVPSGSTLNMVDGGTGALSVGNLALDGLITGSMQSLTVTGSITGKGTTPMLTMGSGAKLKPNGTDFLTITDSLSGTMTIDVSELDFTDRKDDVPLFKVGNASILPAKGDVVVSGELPIPWRLTTTHDGLGYRLNREQGTIITIR